MSLDILVQIFIKIILGTVGRQKVKLDFINMPFDPFSHLNRIMNPEIVNDKKDFLFRIPYQVPKKLKEGLYS